MEPLLDLLGHKKGYSRARRLCRYVVGEWWDLFGGSYGALGMSNVQEKVLAFEKVRWGHNAALNGNNVKRESNCGNGLEFPAEGMKGGATTGARGK